MQQRHQYLQGWNYLCSFTDIVERRVWLEYNSLLATKTLSLEISYGQPSKFSKHAAEHHNPVAYETWVSIFDPSIFTIDRISSIDWDILIFQKWKCNNEPPTSNLTLSQRGYFSTLTRNKPYLFVHSKFHTTVKISSLTSSSHLDD